MLEGFFAGLGHACDDRPMYLRVDESGDFDFSDSDRFALAVIAAVVIPDKCWQTIEAFVAEKQVAWGMLKELKAAQMDEPELLETAELFTTEGLKVVGIATDSRIFDIEAQRRWRTRQVEEFRKAADRSWRAVEDPVIRERVARLRTRLPSERHLKPANFLQYFILMPSLLSRSLSTALVSYRELPGEIERWVFDIAVDPREGADPGKPGDVLRDSLDAIFASDDRTALRIPAEWPTDHPFLVKNADSDVGKVSPRQLLAGGLKTPDSNDDAGLQLADFAAHVIFSALRDGDNEAMALWNMLRPAVMPTEEGNPVQVWGSSDDEVETQGEERYRRLLGS